MKWDGSQSGCDGNHHNEISTALIESINRNDEHWAASRLLMPSDRVQICKPNVATGCGRPHRSRSKGFQPIVAGVIESGNFSLKV